MKTKLKLHLLGLMIFSASFLVHAQGTAFGYQGRLVENGVAPTGQFDFIFRVFDAVTDGIAVSDPVVSDGVAVSAGQFVVSLDFGAGVFTGAPRWLQIEVRPSGAGAHTILDPRQALLPTPYAIFAGSAGSVPTGTVTSEQLNTAIAPSPGQFLSYDGGSLTWTDPGIAVGNVWSVLNNNAYYTAGNVGIGLNSPASRLTVQADGYGIEHTDGTRRLNTYVSASGGWLGTLSNDPLNFFVNGGAARMTVTTGGRIGIGTTTPASRLTVQTTGAFSAYGIEHTDGNVRLSTYLDAGYGAWLGTRTAHALNFFVNDGLPSMSVNADGSISMVSGLGTLTVGSPNAESGTSIIRGGNRGDVRFNGSSIKMVASSGVGPPSSLNGIAVTTAGNVGVGTDAPLARLDVRGTTRTCVLSIVGGCDIAEPFVMKEKELEKGSVVVIDEENPGQLKLSTEPFDTRVAGIISGANGVNTGLALQQEGTFDQGQNVALSGRVYVQADAAFGAIKPGDLLTTSGTPGHAMRVTDHSKAQGAILGKAMTPLRDGKGMVLVLVTLQ